LIALFSDAIKTDGCAAVVDVLTRHQCARDLVEEFVCAKVLPLRAGQTWFDVKDDERYQARGLRVFHRSGSSVAGVKDVYKKVAEATEELIGALGNTEIKAIRATLADRHRVIQVFDLLGLTNPDWPQVESGMPRVGRRGKGQRQVLRLRGCPGTKPEKNLGLPPRLAACSLLASRAWRCLAARSLRARDPAWSRHCRSRAPAPKATTRLRT
jgi:hypothetical protein